MQKLHPQSVEAPETLRKTRSFTFGRNRKIATAAEIFPNNRGSPVRIDPGFPVSIVRSLRDRIDQKARNLPERFRASV